MDNSTNTRPTPHAGVSHGGRPFVVWLIILYAGIAGAVGLIYTPLVLLGMVSVPAPDRALLVQAGIFQWVISLAAGTASWLYPLFVAAYVWGTDTALNNLGQPDNSPRRAAYFLFLLTPLFIVLIGLFFLGISAGLRYFSRYSFRTLVVVSASTAFCMGALFARQGVTVGGLSDASISFAMFGFGTFLCMLLGSTAWWHFSPWRVAPNTRLSG
jgi:hypothetical protein